MMMMMMMMMVATTIAEAAPFSAAPRPAVL